MNFERTPGILFGSILNRQGGARFISGNGKDPGHFGPALTWFLIGAASIVIFEAIMRNL